MIRCIDGNKPSHECNARLNEIEAWMKANVGKRWHAWDWVSGTYGFIMLSDTEFATMFKLKFGI